MKCRGLTEFLCAVAMLMKLLDGRRRQTGSRSCRRSYDLHNCVSIKTNTNQTHVKGSELRARSERYLVIENASDIKLCNPGVNRAHSLSDEMQNESFIICSARDKMLASGYGHQKMDGQTSSDVRDGKEPRRSWLLLCCSSHPLGTLSSVPKCVSIKKNEEVHSKGSEMNCTRTQS
jgi:hypothetical protein